MRIPKEVMSVLLLQVDRMKKRIDQTLNTRPPYGPHVLRGLRSDLTTLSEMLHMVREADLPDDERSTK